MSLIFFLVDDLVRTGAERRVRLQGHAYPVKLSKVHSLVFFWLVFVFGQIFVDNEVAVIEYDQSVTLN